MPLANSDVSPYASTILRVFPAIVLDQVGFFAQHLTVEQPGGGAKIDQEEPVGEYQELTKHDDPKSYIDRIARERKDACCNELVGVVDVDADAKTSPEGDQAEQEQQQPHSAEER